MRYRISKITVQNFKYISENTPVTIELNDKRMVILSGQNGYGKTTFFDTIEMAFTGKIDRLEEIRNRHQAGDDLRDLANDTNKDIVFCVELESEEKEKVVIKRVFNHLQNYENELFWNDDKVDDETLFKRLNCSENMFRRAIYMSQSKSLEFLGKRLKDRKDIVSELGNVKHITDRVAFLKDTKKSLAEKIARKQEELAGEVESISTSIDKLRREISLIQGKFTEDCKYQKLFDGEIDFDKESIDTSIPFNSLIAPVNHLKNFIEEYDVYDCRRFNANVDRILELDQETYKKVYFKKIVDILCNKKNDLEQIGKVQTYKTKLESDDLCIDDEACEILGITEDTVNSIKKQKDSLNQFSEKLSNEEKIILDINKARTLLIEKYNQRVSDGSEKPNVCPLCGAEFEDIKAAFDNTEAVLIQASELSKKAYDLLENNLKDSIQKNILAEINNFLESRKELIEANRLLNSCVDLDIKDLEAFLKEQKIDNWESTDSTPNIAEFNEKYNSLIADLEARKKPVRKIISEEIYEEYKLIHRTYYGNLRPSHNVSDIEKKIAYITTTYNSEAQKQISLLISKKAAVEEKFSRFRKASDDLLSNYKTLETKYSDMQKEYTTKFVTAIRIPVLLLSGKIIQNFPLGLGIDTRVEGNQLTFEAYDKPETDVFNILSSGQLNGLAISILLAMKGVYGKDTGLDALLIDDPLQTIDEISAISLADLLLNSDISQIIMSTHEEYNVKMFKYKYRQRNIEPTEINMKDVYLNAIK